MQMFIILHTHPYILYTYYICPDQVSEKLLTTESHLDSVQHFILILL